MSTQREQAATSYLQSELEKSGISLALARANGLFVTNRGDKLNELMGREDCGRWGFTLVFPYFDAFGNEVVRNCKPLNPPVFTDPKTKEQKVAKYVWPSGVAHHLYIPKTVRPFLGDSGQRLFVTEGEKKTLALVEKGCCAVGVPGVWAFAKAKPEEVEYAPKELLDDWRDIELEGRHVDIAFDSDVQFNDSVKIAESCLVRLLQKRGAVINLLRIPPKIGGGKQGVDDYLLTHTTAELLRLCGTSRLEEEKEMSKELTKEIPALEFYTRPKQVVSFLPLLGEDGYMLEGFFNLLAAYPGCGKTEMLWQCCKQWIASGRKVLYMTDESESVWAMRTPPTQSGINFFFGLGENNLEITAAFSTTPQDIIIVDTMRGLGLMPEDESNNGQINTKLTPYKASAEKRKKTVIVVHHVNKLPSSHGREVSGGHALSGIIDSETTLGWDPNGHPLRRVLKSIRVRGCISAGKTMVTELDESTGGIGIVGDTKKLRQEQSEQCVVNALSDEMSTLHQILERCEDPKPKLDALRRVLTSLTKEGKAVRDESRGSTGRNPGKWKRGAFA